MKTEVKTIRALLVDDHALFRESVAQVLAYEPDLKVDHCSSIREAMQILSQQPIDLVLLDHDLGSERASQFLPAARQMGFEGRVLRVPAWVRGTEARRLMRQGAVGIFLKQAPVAELIDSIRRVAAGQTLSGRTYTAPEDAAAGQSGAPVFNDRQRKVLRFVLE